MEPIAMLPRSILISIIIISLGTLSNTHESYVDIELNALERLQTLLTQQSLAELSPVDSVEHIATKFAIIMQSPLELFTNSVPNDHSVNDSHSGTYDSHQLESAIQRNMTTTPSVVTHNFHPTLPPWVPTKEPEILKNISANCWLDLVLVIRAGSELGKLAKLNCSNSNATLEKICTAEKAKEMAALGWITRMVDSLGKPESNLLQGNLYWLGSWDECRIVKVSEDRNKFTGQYCKSTLNLGNQASLNSNSSVNATAPIKVNYGLCVPDSCNSEDVDVILIYAVQQLKKDSRFKEVADEISFSGSICHPPQEVLGDSKAVVTIVCLAVWLTILILASAFDYLDYEPKLEAIRLRQAEHQAQQVAFFDKVGVEFGEKPETEAEYIKKAPLMTKILVGLSLQRNFTKMMSTQRRPGSFDCVHGIRFLSMTWVVLGHTYYYALSVVDNIGKLPAILKEPTMQTVLNATVSVDTFFVISGILLAYLWLKEAEKSKGKMLISIKTWFLYFFHRYVRLTPVYMIILGVEVALFKYLGRGPLWPQQGVEPYNCKYWWTNLLYINNFFGAQKLCMGHSWFLADDMQFHVFAPILLVALYLFPPIAFSFAAILIVGSAVWRGYYVGTNNFAPNSLWTINPNFDPSKYDYFNHVYVVPWMRLGPYVWGLLVGYILYKIKGRRLRIPKAINLLVWALNLAIMCAVVYGMFHWVSTSDKMPPALNGVYAGVNRTVWGMAISWMVFACITGNGGIIEKFLSWPGFFPLSRLTYCAYLVHPYVLQLTYFGRDEPVHVDSQYTMVYYFLAHLAIAYATAFVFSISFEATAMNLEKILLEKFMSSDSQSAVSPRKAKEEDEVKRTTTEVTFLENENSGKLEHRKHKKLSNGKATFRQESELESGVEQNEDNSSDSSSDSQESMETLDSGTATNGGNRRLKN